jgi:hypothetical protein
MANNRPTHGRNMERHVRKPEAPCPGAHFLLVGVAQADVRACREDPSGSRARDRPLHWHRLLQSHQRDRVRAQDPRVLRSERRVHPLAHPLDEQGEQEHQRRQHPALELTPTASNFISLSLTPSNWGYFVLTTFFEFGR